MARCVKYRNLQFEPRSYVPHSVCKKVEFLVEIKYTFVQCTDSVERESIDPRLRMIAVLRMLAYEMVANTLDKSIQILKDSDFFLSTKRPC